MFKERSWFLLILITMCSAGLSWADQVVLKEGKTITGEITDEDEHEVTINLGRKMVLRVDKSKIKSITRDPKEEPAPSGTSRLNTGVKRMAPSPVASTSTVHVAVSTTVVKPLAVASSSVTMPAPAPAPIKNTSPVGPQAERKQKDNVTFFTTTIKKPSALTEIPASVALGDHAGWNCTWEGTPGQEEGQFKWKTVVVSATNTVTVPESRLKNPTPEQTKSWNAFVDQTVKHNQEHLDIFADSLQSLGIGLASLKAANAADLKTKSEELYKEIMSRTDNRNHGLDRREASRKKDSLPKK